MKNMYRQLILFLFLVSLLACSASRKSGQEAAMPVASSAKADISDPKEAKIRETFGIYFNTVEQGDYGKTIAYIYPRLFDLVPKEAMLKAMQQINADPTIQISMDSSIINDISKVHMVGDSAYARVDYTFRMIMKLIPEERETDETSDPDLSEEGEEEEFNHFDFTADMLEGVYGEKNVRRNKENQTLYIRIDASMFAIKDPEFEGWMFLEKKDQLMPVLEQLIPEVILEKL